MSSRVTLRRKSRTAPEETEEQVAELAASEDEGKQGNEALLEDEEKEEDVAQEPVASTSSLDSGKGNFVLVMDNGQLSLVPASKAHSYRSLPERGQKMEDESGTSTPTLKSKKKSRSLLRSSEAPSPRIIVRPLKRGRGRPPKKRSRSRMLEFEVEEEEEEPEEDEDEVEDGEEEEFEEDGVETPAGDNDPPASDDVVVAGDDDDLIPPAREQNVYVHGKDYLLKNDELVLDIDEEGEKKIDEKGNLLGGREYNFKTFSSPYRTDKEVQYALSIDVARGAGFRDSLYFFRRNPLLIKLSCTDKEKVMLIEQEQLSGQLRSRNVTMLAVRNVFKTLGAKVVKEGRYIADDYNEKEVRERGTVEEQPAEEESSVPPPPPRAIERRKDTERDRDRARRRPDAFTFSTSDLQGNAIYTTFGDAGLSPFERAKGWNARRVNLQRADLDEENWMMEMARSVRGMNHEILSSRNERLKAFPRPYEGIEEGAEDADQIVAAEGEESIKKRSKIESLPIGFYEPMTNMPHFFSSTQPTWATMERVRERPLLGKATEESKAGPAVLGNAKVGNQGWGIASFDQIVRLPTLPVKGVIVPAGASVEEE